MIADLAKLIGARFVHRSRKEAPLIVGLCGAQGSGKTTLAGQLEALLTSHGRTVANLSLDDFYLRRAERTELAARIHPLLQTRGVPGTHDVGLIQSTLTALTAGERVPIPRFEKALDDRIAPEIWPAGNAPDVILFEGWCVGARAQRAQELLAPCNVLERDEDADGGWRAYVNERLSTDYAALFARLDVLILLAAPSFDCVFLWRKQQEDALRNRAAESGRTPSSLMNDRELARFILFYERITRHVLAEMPGRADATVQLDAERNATLANPAVLRPQL